MRGRKILTWCAAGLLTLSLTLCVLCFFAVRALTDHSLHEQITTNDTVMGWQMARAEEKIGELAQEYRFPAELTTDLLTLEAFREKNREVAAWWTEVLTTGKSNSTPDWKLPELRSALEMNPSFAEGLDESEVASRAIEATEAVEKVLSVTVLPVRIKLVRAGLDWLQKRVHVGSLVRFASGLPVILLALAALLAGLIALINVRHPVGWMRIFGCVLGGAALSLAVVMLLFRLLNLDGMIREASQVLSAQYGILAGNTLLRLGLMTLGFAALSALLLILFSKRTRGKHMKKAETA